MGIAAALDFSGITAGFAVGKNDTREVLGEEFKEMSGRHSAGLMNWINDLLGKQGLTVHDVQHWTVGNGPGSFTGLRLVAALVLGITYKKETTARGISNALGMVAAADIEHDSMGIALFKGRRDDVIRISVKRLSADTYTLVGRELIDLEQDKGVPDLSDATCVTMLERDFSSLPEDWQNSLNDAIITYRHCPVAGMMFINPGETDRRSLTELEYIRPAAYTEPITPRVVKGVD